MSSTATRAVSGLTLAAAAIGAVLVGVSTCNAAESSAAPPQQSGRLLGPAPAPKIKVTRSTPEAAPSPTLRAAYDAMQARDYDTAARLYDQVARDDARNVDALLGVAAIAANRGDFDRARNQYLAVLRIEPAHALAQAALLALFGRADYATAELRLKELAGREPSAFVYQALATLYAEQGLWPQAQHAYFQAYRLDPRDPDHAYNLAVGLEHVGQHTLAATYYRRAVELARVHPTGAFDAALAASRAAQLAAAGNN